MIRQAQRHELPDRVRHTDAGEDGERSGVHLGLVSPEAAEAVLERAHEVFLIPTAREDTTPGDAAD